MSRARRLQQGRGWPSGHSVNHQRLENLLEEGLFTLRSTQPQYNSNRTRCYDDMVPGADLHITEYVSPGSLREEEHGTREGSLTYANQWSSDSPNSEQGQVEAGLMDDRRPPDREHRSQRS
ncbi:unnamed protein product [Gadus morhua 'NCC']